MTPEQVVAKLAAHEMAFRIRGDVASAETMAEAIRILSEDHPAVSIVAWETTEPGKGD